MKTQVARLLTTLLLLCLATGHALAHSGDSTVDTLYRMVMPGAACMPMTDETTGIRVDGRYEVTSKVGWVTCPISTFYGPNLEAFNVSHVVVDYFVGNSLLEIDPRIPGEKGRRLFFGCTSGGFAPSGTPGPSGRGLYFLQASWSASYLPRPWSFPGIKPVTEFSNLVCHLPKGGKIDRVTADILTNIQRYIR